MKCTVCKSPKRDEIDASFMQQLSTRLVAKKFGLTTHQALARHRKKCLADTLGYLNEERGALHARVGLPQVKSALAAIESSRVTLEPGVLETPEDVLVAARRMHQELEEMTEEARRLGDGRMALLAIRERVGLLQFFGRAYKMFDESGVKIDQSTKVVNFLGKLSDDELRAFGEAVAS